MQLFYCFHRFCTNVSVSLSKVYCAIFICADYILMVPLINVWTYVVTVYIPVFMCTYIYIYVYTVDLFFLCTKQYVEGNPK